MVNHEAVVGRMAHPKRLDFGICKITSMPKEQCTLSKTELGLALHFSHRNRLVDQRHTRGVVIFLVPIQDLYPRGAAVSSGQLAFNNACRTCHSIRKGNNRLGPTLYNILGRKAGFLPDYGYSSAMRSADFIWDKATLDRFIANPDAIVPGNYMKPYGGPAPADASAK